MILNDFMKYYNTYDMVMNFIWFPQNCASYVQHKASIEICLTCQDLQIEQAILINPV